MSKTKTKKKKLTRAGELSNAFDGITKSGLPYMIIYFPDKDHVAVTIDGGAVDIEKMLFGLFEVKALRAAAMSALTKRKINEMLKGVSEQLNRGVKQIKAKSKRSVKKKK